MAKDFSKFTDDNPVMAILEKAKQEQAALEKESKPEVTPVEITPVETVQTAPATPIVQEIPETQVTENKPEEIEIKKILMNISIRESTKKEWKMFFLEHDLSMTQGIETAVEYLMSEVRKNNIKLSKGGITK
ncbi:MAG: hypothetical protein J5527_14590 [Treponema sp.]|nr:hypothetical protein [Treponema sp.]